MEKQNTWGNLPELLYQAKTNLAAPTVYYLLGGRYYDRDNHPYRLHCPFVTTALYPLCRIP
jgi:hypothetical protein